MAKAKSANSKGSVSYAKGRGHMFGKQHAGPDKPGVSSSDKTGDGGKWAKGGNGRMFPKQHAGPQVAGGTGAKQTSGDGGKFAKGGTTKMFSYQGSKVAKPGCSAP